MTPQSDNSFKLSWKQIIVAFFVVVYIAINLFRIGGDALVIELNNFLAFPLALGATLLAFAVWLQTKNVNTKKSIWLGLAIGWAMWAIAELWWAIASSLSQELPYPSWADFFWLVGYIPMYSALLTHSNALPKIDNPTRKISIWIATLFFSGVTALFILLPIIRDSDPTAIVESVISLLYPLADIFLLIFVLRLLFSYQQGIYGLTWRWLAAGFILSSLGDLAFSYAATVGIYYPDGQANLFSTLGVDIPYNISYLVFMVGLLQFKKLLGAYRPVSVSETKLGLVPNTHLLIFAKDDNTVIDVSHNYSRVFPIDNIKGKSISEILGISLDNEHSILKVIKNNGMLQERMLGVTTQIGTEPALISGISTDFAQKEHSGSILLVRILTTDYALDKLLTEFERGMVRSLLQKTGVEQKEQGETKQLLLNYYQPFIQSFFNRAFAEGESIMADAFIADLRLAIKQHEWQIRIESDLSVDISRLSLSEVRKTLPILFERGKQFIVKLTDENTANAIIHEVRSKFGEMALENISLHIETTETELP